MSDRKIYHPLLVISTAALSWVTFFIALIAFQTIFIRRDHTIDSDWWLFCLGMGFVVFWSTIGIAAARTYSNGKLIAHLAGGIAGSVFAFALFGLLAESLSQHGFPSAYLPIGIVPGALQGLATYAVIRAAGIPEGHEKLDKRQRTRSR